MPRSTRVTNRAGPLLTAALMHRITLTSLWFGAVMSPGRLLPVTLVRQILSIVGERECNQQDGATRWLVREVNGWRGRPTKALGWARWTFPPV